MKSHIRYIFYLLLLLLIGNSSCRDDMFNDMYGTADGYSRIKLSYSFDSFHPTGIGSRSYGDMYDAVRNLWVVVYQQQDEDGSFALYDGYPKQIYKSASSDTSDPSTLPGSSHANDISQSISLPAGTYQLYAVANIDNFDNKYKDQISTPADLKAINLKWQQTDQGIPTEDNDQMFGYFSTGTSTTAEGDETDPETITVGTGSLSLHADLVRAASKVTVAYDGSLLADGISIYIKSVSIKNIPLVCYLGNPNKIESAGDLTDGETVTYSDTESGNPDFPYPLITKASPYYPSIPNPDYSEGDAAGNQLSTALDDQSAHSHTSENSLFFYENLQGTDPDLDKSAFTETDGTPDQFNYEAKPYATYIEVATHYISENPENPMVSDIVYRFMLGTNITDNFDAIRNYHYKLTLRFIGTTPEPDWRIDYVNVLGVTQPKPVNYKGQQFNYNGQFADNNGGNDFGPNTFTVNSFQYNSKESNNKKSMPFRFDYGYTDEEGKFNVYDKKPDWIEKIEQGETSADGRTECTISYKIPSTTVKLSESFPAEEVTGTFDLSRGGKSDAEMNTANCYIVQAKGTYTLPLVYGNAIKGGAENSSAYTGFGGWTDDKTVSQIVDDSKPYEITVGDKKEMTLPAPQAINTLLNYKNERISSPYILTDVGTNINNVTASIVWTDVKNLITDVGIDNTTYGTNGGITFKVGDNITEGNGVLAVKDNEGNIMWSWHIWVTSLDLDFLVPVTAHRWNYDKQFEIMPVNLGWCSNGGEVVYYDRHECEVRVTQILTDEDEKPYDGYSQTITIVQEPHIDVPMGNNTYFQWGRKDPFVGTNSSWTSKTWYVGNEQNSHTGYIPYNDNFPGEVVGSHWVENKDWVNPNTRKPTIEIIGSLIQNPEKFNNPRFHGFELIQYEKNADGSLKFGADGKPIVLKPGVEGSVWDQIYINLWSDDVKTVYDPCPVGFQVSPKATYTGFTIWGNPRFPTEWPTMAFNVPDDYMSENYRIENGLFGFYTNFHSSFSKVISLGFPLTGYLDYDAVQVYYMAQHCYIWTSSYFDNPLDWDYPSVYEKDIAKNNNAYDLKVATGNSGIIDPLNGFYATDGFAVRPTRIVSQ